MKKSLKIIFAGTPDIASYYLYQLIQSQHQIIAVFTSPDKPYGRGKKIRESKVKKIALQYKIPIFQPISLFDYKSEEIVQKLNADIMVIVAYGLIIPETIFSIPKFGCINVHGSLLPRFRGAAPIQHALLNGDKETGVTIIKINSQLDSGDILSSIKYNLHKDDTSESLFQKFVLYGSQILFETLTNIIHGNIEYIPQNIDNITYANKINKIDALLDWKLPARKLECFVRAFNPWPISYFFFKDKIIKVWKASISKQKVKTTPGTILNINQKGIEIATSCDNFIIEKLQFPNKKILLIKELSYQYKKFFSPGTIL